MNYFGILDMALGWYCKVQSTWCYFWVVKVCIAVYYIKEGRMTVNYFAGVGLVLLQNVIAVVVGLKFSYCRGRLL